MHESNVHAKEQVATALLTLARVLPSAFDSPAEVGIFIPDLTAEVNRLRNELMLVQAELVDTKSLLIETRRLCDEVLYRMETDEIVKTME